ncbi:RHS repeat-associated core domain-containing protein [Micromonospora sp. NPDC127501]|uniref:RHS repeat-associated core domain-containing protein n=1 Tax=Micromonospora sp. NPDC127501 TaxID=3154872 RepID=UPI00333079F2
MALRHRAFWTLLIVTASVLTVPTAPATAALSRPESTTERISAPAQPGSPGSSAAIALGPSSAPVSMLAGPISVPVGTGPVRNGSFTSFALTDRVTAEVNTGSGNLLIRSTDLVLPGIARDLVLGSAYNSLFTGSGLSTGSLGHGWRTRTGVDVKLIKADDNSVTYVASDGVVGRFTPNGSGYTTPNEFKATLVTDGSGWKLTEHESGRRLYFTSAGLLDRSLDRNDNVTDYAYDGNGRLTTVVSDRGTQAVRTATVVYGSHGYISKIEQHGDGGLYRRVEYAYNANGDLTEICSLTEDDVRFAYDSSHRITKISSGIRGSDVGSVATLTYDSAHRVTSIQRVIDEEDAPGATAVTRWAYPSATQTLIADANTNQSQPVTSVPRTTYTINSDKRVTKAVDPEGKTRENSYTPYNDVLTSTNGTGGVTSNGYAANGGQSLTASAAPTGADIAYSYANSATPTNPTANFQPSSSSDAQGNTSTYTYNGAGNRLSSKDAQAAEAKIEYNSDGTVKSSTDPGNGTNKTTYQYDSNKQLISVTPPSGTSLGVRTINYDEFGRVHEATDGAGRTTHFDYDKNDRVTKISYSDATPDVSYTYDAAGNVYAREDGNGYQNFAHDRLNRLVGRQATHQYIYDPVGNLVELRDQRGSSFYTYNARNLLTKLVAANGTYTFEYDDDGRRTATRLAVSSVTVAETVTAYDQSGRITRTTSKRWQSGTASTVFDVSYCYAKRVGTAACSTVKTDDTGLRQWQTDHHRAGAVSIYTYDQGNRLTKATSIDGKTYDYAYDSNGNRTSVKVDGTTTQTLTYNAGNQITSSGYSYDGAGNQKSGSAARSFVYNAAGQLTSGKDSTNASVTWEYSGPDQIELGWKTTPSFEHRYLYGLDDQNGQPMLQSYTVPSSYSRHYVERDQLGTPLGFRAKTNGVFHHYFYVLDGLGSVVALVKYDGSLAASYTYDPYGKVVKTVDNGDETEENALGFAAGLRSDDLTKFGRRWYDPATGRFTQQDSLAFLGDPATGNRYAYAAANPVNYLDPTGLEVDYGESCAIGAAGGLITGAIGGATGGVAGALAGGALGAVGGCVGGVVTKYLTDEAEKD